VNIAFHPNAKDLAKRNIADFSDSLVLQAKILAYQQKDDMVLCNHVRDALDIISKRKKTKWTRDLGIVIGSALFGTFVQGFVAELSSTPINPALIAIYTILGVAGLIGVFWELRT
jgi:hypothetical protein